MKTTAWPSEASIGGVCNLITNKANKFEIISKEIAGDYWFGKIIYKYDHNDRDQSQ